MFAVTRTNNAAKTKNGIITCKVTGRGRVPANFVGERPYDIRLKLEAEFDKYYDMVVSLSRSKRLTIPAIKTMITGVGCG